MVVIDGPGRCHMRYSDEATPQGFVDTFMRDEMDNACTERWSYKVEPEQAGFVIVAYDEEGFCLGPL